MALQLPQKNQFQKVGFINQNFHCKILQFITIFTILIGLYQDIFDNEKGKLLHTFHNWGPSYGVEFDLILYKIPQSSPNGQRHANIFQFTTGFDNGKMGQKIPAAFLRLRDNLPNYAELKIYTGINDEPNYDCLFYIEPNRRYHIHIKQYKDLGCHYYEIEIDGLLKHLQQNSQAEKLDNVKMYTSSPWYPSFSSEYGILENFVASQDTIGSVPTPTKGEKNIILMAYTVHSSEILDV